MSFDNRREKRTGLQDIAGGDAELRGDGLEEADNVLESVVLGSQDLPSSQRNHFSTAIERKPHLGPLTCCHPRRRWEAHWQLVRGRTCL